MPGSPKNAELVAYHMTPYAIYRSAVAAVDSSVSAVTQIIDLTTHPDGANAKIYITANRKTGSGDITLSLYRDLGGSLLGTYVLVAGPINIVGPVGEIQFTNLVAMRHKVVCTEIGATTTYDLHVSYSD